MSKLDLRDFPLAELTTSEEAFDFYVQAGKCSVDGGGADAVRRKEVKQEKQRDQTYDYSRLGLR